MSGERTVPVREEPIPVGDGGFSWTGIYHAIREKLWLIVLATVVGTIAAFAHLRYTQPIYAATTVMQIEQERRVVNIQDVNQEDFGSVTLVNTMLQRLTSRTLLEKVVTRYNLNEDYDFMPKAEAGPHNQEHAIARLSQCVRGALRTGTRLIDVTVEHLNPAVAEKVAGYVASEFVRFAYEQRTTSENSANQFLLQEAERLKNKLQQSEQALLDYKRRNDAATLTGHGDVVGGRVAGANQSLADAKLTRVRLESDLAQAQKLAGQPEKLLLLPSIATHPAVATLREGIAQKEGEMSILAQRYKAKHPKYIALHTEIEMLKSRLQKTVLGAADLLANEVQAARDTETTFTRALKEQESEAFDLGEVSIQYNVMMREMETDRAMYESVLQRMKETDLTKGMQDPPVTIIEPAFSYGPVRPDRKKILLYGILGGLAVGIGLTLGLNAIDSSVRTVDQAENLLGVSVLTAVPQSTKRVHLEKRGELPVLAERRGQIAEAFRTLRTSLTLLGREEERRIFLFTSAQPGEGKTFTTANCSIALGQQGLRTLVIDGDLRRPNLSRVFFGEDRAPGLVDYLAGQEPLERIVHASDQEHVTVIPAGSRAPNPAELLASEGFLHLLELCSGIFDRILIDSAPINAVSDTLLLAPHVQSVCMVVHAGKTPRGAVLRAARALTEISRQPVGIILNRLPAHRRGRYYYYSYYSGYYGRTGVYGSDRGGKKGKRKRSKRGAPQPADAGVASVEGGEA